MGKIDIKPYLSAVVAKFNERQAKLQKIGSEQLCETDYFLSEVLLMVAAGGTDFPFRKLENTALALELLFQAITFGEQVWMSSFFSDELLLATDYYYAEAIEQVVGLNEPEVVRLLAKAIADTAAKRSSDNYAAREGNHLFAAAVELGLFLGAHGDAERKSIRKSLNNLSNSNKSEVLKSIHG